MEGTNISSNPTNYSSQTQSEIERLEALGFDRRNMKVLPDGSIVFIEHDKAGDKERLENMMARKRELDYMATSSAMAGMEIDPDLEKEYLQLCKELDAAFKSKD